MLWGINRKYLWIGIVILLCLPIVFNLLIFSWRNAYTFGETESWINFFGSYLGGIVGGLLTLSGVLLTLTRDDRKERIDKCLNQLVILNQFADLFRQIDMEVAALENELEKASYYLDCISKIDSYSTRLYQLVGGEAGLRLYRENERLRLIYNDFIKSDRKSIEAKRTKSAIEDIFKIIDYEIIVTAKILIEHDFQMLLESDERAKLFRWVVDKYSFRN